MKCLAIILSVQTVSCFLPVRGFSAGDASGVRAIANAIKHDLQENTGPSFTRGRGPVDLDYKLNALLMQLCAMDLRASDVSLIDDRIKSGVYDPVLRDVSEELARTLPLIAAETVTAADVQVLLTSKTPGVRATGCFLAGKLAVKEVVPQLRALAAADPYILVTSDQRASVSFVAPVREKAADALRRLGEPPQESAVRIAEGFVMLERLFAQKPELRLQIESLLESALRSDFHGRKFQENLREFAASQPMSAELGERTFLDLCRKLSGRPSQSAKEESEWPTDSEGKPLPAPPTRP